MYLPCKSECREVFVGHLPETSSNQIWKIPKIGREINFFPKNIIFFKTTSLHELSHLVHFWYLIEEVLAVWQVTRHITFPYMGRDKSRVTSHIHIWNIIPITEQMQSLISTGFPTRASSLAIHKWLPSFTTIWATTTIWAKLNFITHKAAIGLGLCLGSF